MLKIFNTHRKNRETFLKKLTGCISNKEIYARLEAKFHMEKIMYFASIYYLDQIKILLIIIIIIIIIPLHAS